MVGFLGMAAFYMIPVQIPFYLNTLDVTSGLVVGVAIATATLMSAVIGNFYERIQSNLGYLGTLAVLLLLFGIGYVLIGHAASLPGIVLGIAVSGLGMGLLMPTLNSWLGDLAPKHIRGSILGGLTTCFFLGQFVSTHLDAPRATHHRRAERRQSPSSSPASFWPCWPPEPESSLTGSGTNCDKQKRKRRLDSRGAPETTWQTVK